MLRLNATQTFSVSLAGVHAPHYRYYYMAIII